MPDGTPPIVFRRHAVTPTVKLRPGEVAVDLFAGGGGASEAIRQALGLDPFVAVNHDQWAIGMHRANHPGTKHFCEDVWEVDPRAVCAGHVVGLLHGSPDCTHFSQAKGGQHRSREIRSLSWVLLKWAGRLHPRIITLENVKQILQWTRLVAKRDKATGRVVTLDVLVDPVTGRKTNRVAEPGERVPVENQFLVPDKKQLGSTWSRFVAELRAMGYVVEWKLMRASDFGAGTSRERLFMCARRDGETIRFPEPSHGNATGAPGVTAADCIDWSIECPSIFGRGRWRWNKAAEKFDWIDKPLADATLRRIARGIKRYVLDSAQPFIVPNNTNNAPKPVSLPVPTITTCDGRNLLVEPVLAPFAQPMTHQGDARTYAPDEPLPVITAAHRGEIAAVTPVLAPFITEHANGSSQRNMPANEPLRTLCAQVKGGHFAVVAPVLVQAAHGEGSGPTKRRGSGAHDVQQPLGVVHAGGGSFAVAAATLVQTGYGERDGQQPRSLDLQRPLGTVVGGAVKHAVVTASLEPANTSGGSSSTAAAHLLKIRGSSDGGDLLDPLPTITSGAGAKRAAGAAHAMGVITAFLEQANGGGPHGKPARARGAAEPVSSITGSGSQQRLVTAHLVTMRHFAHGQSVDDPLGTVCSGTVHHGTVECTLADANRAESAEPDDTLKSQDDLNLPPDVEASALRVAAFLIRYYGEGGQWGDLREPMDTVTTRDRLALVTVTIKGQPYVIVDIGLRMLKPHELFKAQGFPADYIIDRLADGTRLSATKQVRMVGNSVSPPPYRALLEANLDSIEIAEQRMAA